MARGRTTPTTLREISKARAKKIKERMVALGSAGELSVTEIAAAVNEEFAVALSRESVYSVLKRSGIRMEYAYIDGSKAQVKRREESLDQLRSELQENAAAFLADYRPLAPVPAQLRATRLEEMGFDSPIEAIIPFHDLHFGSFIDPRVSAGFAYYDPDVARERLVRWRNLVLRFTQREQLTTTLENAHLLALGDDIEGHGEMFGTQKLGMAEPVGFQVLGFVDDMSNVLLSYLERYKHITVYKVHGNHGRITAKARDSYPPDNLELTAWGNIADRVRVHTGGDWLPMTPAGVRVLKGGMIDFYIASSPVMLLEILAFKFLIMHGHGVKGLASTYCMTPETPVLTQDLRWMPAGELSVGQPIIGFDDEAEERHFRRATVTATGKTVAPVYALRLANGDMMRVTDEHRLLVKFPGHNEGAGKTMWARADMLAARYAQTTYPGKHGDSRVKVSLYVRPWEAPKNDRVEGLLAGAFDADGSATFGRKNRWPCLRFTQQDNGLLVAVEEALTEKGFQYKKTLSQAPRGGNIWQVQVQGGRSEQLRFLGQIRPARLLELWDKWDIDAMHLIAEEAVPIDSVEYVGQQEVATISSSTGTYIGAGYGQHNTGAIDTKLRYNSIIGETINYLVKAHLHESQQAEHEIGGAIIQGGCFVGPSLLSISGSRPQANLPSQELFFMHPKHGKVHHEVLHLATVKEMRQFHEWVGRR